MYKVLIEEAVELIETVFPYNAPNMPIIKKLREALPEIESLTKERDALIADNRTLLDACHFYLNNVIPQGYALVPVEPTEEMIKAAHPLINDGWDKAFRECAIADYKAMIQAAPTINNYSEIPNRPSKASPSVEQPQLTDDELLPCPFCGGEAAIRIGEHIFYDAKVTCQECGAEGTLADSECQTKEQNISEASKAWNTRAILAAQQSTWLTHVWAVESRTASMLFTTKELAEKYAGDTPSTYTPPVKRTIFGCKPLPTPPEGE